MTQLFQRRATERNERFASQQQLRSERMTVYSDFAGAVTEFRRGQADRWHRTSEDPDGPACFEARMESYRLRARSLHALFRVQLIASGPTTNDAAQHAHHLTARLHTAPDETEFDALAQQARDAVQQFVRLASSDVQ